MVRTALSSGFIRWTGGLVNVVAGVLIVVGFLIHPGAEDIPSILSPLWVPAHALAWIGFTLALLGYIGLYARQAERAGTLGLAGFLVLFIGTALVLWAFGFAATTEPLVAASAPEVLEAIVSSSVSLVFILIVVMSALGGIVFGASIILAKRLHRYGGVLLILGSLMLLIGLFAGWPGKVVDVGPILFGLGQIWLGYDLWNRMAAGRR